MEKVEIRPGKKIDLVIQDADGRPTTYHDLSAEEVTPGLIVEKAANGFNALLALSIIRTLCHISQDDAICKFYRNNLIEERGYIDAIEQTVKIMYQKNKTNYSNVNMAFVAIYGLLRFEKEPALAKRYRAILEEHLYAPGVPRQAKGLKQSFFDFIYAAFRKGGAGGAGQTAVKEGHDTLKGYPKAPHWNDPVINCDDNELKTKQCKGFDGSTIELSSDPGRHGLVANHPLPMKIRPHSNFEWRSDPHRVNEGGSARLNPGGGFYCAYWMGRLLQSETGDTPNISPHAFGISTSKPGESTGTPDASGAPDAPASEPSGGEKTPTADTSGATEKGGTTGCGCQQGSPDLGALLVLLLLLVASRGRRAARA